MAANRRLGEVEFTIGADTYVARFGNRELASLEEMWNVKGIAQIWGEGAKVSNKRFVEWCRAALLRHQPHMTFDAVADLLDYRDEDGTSVAARAIAEAFDMIIPKAKPETPKPETAPRLASA